MLLLLACVGTRVSEVPVEETWDVRIVDGPWAEGSDIALAATGPKTLEGQWQGPAIVMVVWLQEGMLLLTATFDGGRGWTAPKVVAEELEGPLEVDMALGSPVVIARRAGHLVRLDRDEGGWVEEDLGAVIAAELANVDGRAVVAWTDEGGLLIDGDRVYEGEVCGPPAVGSRDRMFVDVAFRARDTEGAVELVRVTEEINDDGDLTWSVTEPLTAGGWQACPTEAIAMDEGRIFYSDGRSGSRQLWMWDGEREQVLPTEAGWDVLDVGAAAGMVTWTAESPTEHRMLIEGVSLLTSSERRYRPGEPSDVAGELWLPFFGLKATVAAYRPPAVLR